MTQDGFRRLALALPEAVESAHMAHPDFRVGGKIFATLAYPDDRWGVVVLHPEQQDLAIEAEPAAFKPASGAWGRGGSTTVHLDKAETETLGEAMTLAWQNAIKKGAAKKSRRTKAK